MPPVVQEVSFAVVVFFLKSLKSLQSETMGRRVEDGRESNGQSTYPPLT